MYIPITHDHSGADKLFDICNEVVKFDGDIGTGL